MNRYALAMTVVAACASTALAESMTSIQYFEAEWSTIRYRMPDVFVAGYDATWLPPPQRGENATADIGYALFDRFDLGNSTSPTRYGTEETFRRVVDEFHKANCRVVVDWLMNHNATRDSNDAAFVTQGGYPGFVMQAPGDPHGDFHTPGTQSENPGGANFNLFEGRLVGLIDIAQEKNHVVIRHPVTMGDPNNIVAGTLYNKVDPANARFYPDLSQTPLVVNSPGTPQNPGSFNYTIYPYNTVDPMQGDAVPGNATELLLRSTRYYLEVLGVDGFRLDAAKHIPTWFWDNLWDAHVFNRYVAFDGTVQTPFSYVEAVGGGGIDPFDYTRKDGFGNRDALDLDEAGAVRDMVDNPGGKSWTDVLNASIDNRDGGFNNGSLGVHHVSSHDNANAGTNMDTFAHAYVLMRSGPAIVYHNALQFGISGSNFPRRNGRDDALGLGGNAITTLVKLRKQLVRGRFDVLNGTDTVNPSLDDIIIMQHSRELGGGNRAASVVIGVSDLQSNGQNATDQRSVQTDFPPGTRLHELTGNAANPVVDLPGNATDDVAEVLTTDANRRILIRVPRNRNANGVQHGLGYVVYAPALPTGTLSFNNVAFTVPADSGAVPAAQRRLTPIEVIQTNFFRVRLDTTQTDLLDPNTDDDAAFKIDQGFADYNGNGVVDRLDPTRPDYGFESFVTENTPLFSNPGEPGGRYRQMIDVSLLGEGMHYIEVLAFRHRTDGGDPIHSSFRKVIYIDRLPPAVTLEQPTATCSGDVTALPMTVTVKANDPTVDRVYIYRNLPEGTDFAALAALGVGQAPRSGDAFTVVYPSAVSGNHRIDVLSFEDFTGNSNHQTFTGINATTGSGLGVGDVNADGIRDGRDIQTFVNLILNGTTFNPAADMNCDGLNNADDVPGFVSLLLN